MAGITVTSCSLFVSTLVQSVSYPDSRHAVKATDLLARPLTSVIFHMLEDSKHCCQNE